jgi:hypothetical protein
MTRSNLGPPSPQCPPWRSGACLVTFLLAVVWPMAVVARPAVGATAGVQDCSVVTAIAIGDGYAYAGTELRLTIFDIRDPAAPAR